ncbi:MAG: VWA domain-containing protein [Planctomycetaceae bacterium]|nr:VWA domain-containing protein [Planctomycetaceae bacterium]
MFSITDMFDQPGYLLLLLLLPLIWVLSYHSLSGLGPIRRWVAIGLRSFVFSLIVLALAEMQFLRVNDGMTVIYLLDQSASIPQTQRNAMVEYVKEAVREQRDDSQKDRAALIVFGRNANIEVPPLQADLPIPGQLESIFDLRTDATNLASAMKLAQATFPEDSSRRIVVVTDGNENVGDAQAMARLLAQDGVGIDVVPISLGDRPEVFVERVTLPSDIRKGQPFQARVVVNNVFQPTENDAGEVAGTIKLTRRMGQRVETLSEQPIVLQPGKNVYRFDNEIQQPDFYEYEAIFVPDDPENDVMIENNRATAFTHVLGQGHVLLIEDWEHPGEFDFLINRLRDANIQVTVIGSNELFTSLAELQRYDSVILANVPRSSGNETNITNFSDNQIEMLVRNTQDMGCGLIMLGGPNSFGAGGWSNTELEKAMPVDFQIQNAKVVPVGALAMVMHASEMAQGNYWQKKIGEEALKSLGPQDFCGVVHWNGNEEWLWGHPQGLIKVGPNRRRMVARLSRMTPGDMPDFDPSLKLAAAAFGNCKQAAIKHMIVISDGDPAPASQAVLNTFKKLQVKVTTVAVGTHGPAGHQELKRIATATGGKYYVVRNPQALPRIYQREARRVARPLVKEKVVQPSIKQDHEILRGIDSPPPPISGFVLTRLKDNNLVEVSLISPDPVQEKNATILASWTYGLGRTAVLTTDAGKRWANNWTGWEGYDQLFSQLVRWSMRPTGNEGNFTVATDAKDGKVRVIVTALDKNDELLNFLNMSASVVGPDMNSKSIVIRQEAPGRYVGEFEGNQAGSYFLTVTPGPGRAPIRTGINVPYSSEFRDRETNIALLEQLANMVPSGGKKGQLIEGNANGSQALSTSDPNSFRRDLAKQISSSDIWPLLVLLSSCIFLADIFVRRVNVGFDWFQPIWIKVKDFILRREAPPVVDERMARLRSTKRAIDGQIDERRAGTRFEADSEDVVDPAILTDDTQGTAGVKSTPPNRQSPLTPEEAEKESYTSRLLKAKRSAFKGRSDDPKK